MVFGSQHSRTILRSQVPSTKTTGDGLNSSVVDAKRAVDIGATGIMVSNHGGRQLDGSRSPFDQLAEIVGS